MHAFEDGLNVTLYAVFMHGHAHQRACSQKLNQPRETTRLQRILVYYILCTLVRTVFACQKEVGDT
jgi:hypothetical protein